MAQRRDVPTSLVCRNCGANNPLKAYCCLKCFQVLRPKEKIPFWRVQIKPDATMLTLFILVAGAGIYIAKKWIDNVEAQVSMNFSSADYNVSVVADKKKKNRMLSSFGLTKDEPEESATSAETPPVDPAAPPASN